MRETRSLGNYIYQTILHTLKFQDVLESNIMIKGITVVKSTANNRCNSFGDNKRHISANTMKGMNVIKAAKLCCLKFIIIIKGDF